MKPAVISHVKPLLKPSSSQKVRSKFFNMLGIESPPQTSGKNLSSSSVSSGYTQKVSHPRTQGIVNFQEALKYKDNEDSILLFQRRRQRNKQASSPNNKKKRISFNNSVNVVPIPRRDEYSTRISSRMWSNAAEINENAARNSVEFAAEGWDWRTATEDDKMYVCCITGDLIHPVHYENCTDYTL